ncbi:unnamed protein product [Ectocarpus fasciculatus]
MGGWGDGIGPGFPSSCSSLGTSESCSCGLGWLFGGMDFILLCEHSQARCAWVSLERTSCRTIACKPTDGHGDRVVHAPCLVSVPGQTVCSEQSAPDTYIKACDKFLRNDRPKNAWKIPNVGYAYI